MGWIRAGSGRFAARLWASQRPGLTTRSGDRITRLATEWGPPCLRTGGRCSSTRLWRRLSGQRSDIRLLNGVGITSKHCSPRPPKLRGRSAKTTPSPAGEAPVAVSAGSFLRHVVVLPQSSWRAGRPGVSPMDRHRPSVLPTKRRRQRCAEHCARRMARDSTPPTARAGANQRSAPSGPSRWARRNA